VKPANLLLREDGVLKVSDFGIARSATDHTTQLTQAGTILGTAAYLAPEQARGEAAGPPADVFALGVVLYEALTGRVPWPVDGLASLAALGETPPPPIASLAPGTPPPLEAAVTRALAYDPGDRPPDAEAFRRELGGDGETGATVVLSRAAAPAATPGPDAPTALLDGVPSRLRRRLRGGVLLAAALVAAAVAVVLTLALVSGRDDGGSSSGGGSPAGAQVEVEPVPSADDAAGQARALEQWIRDHTRGAG